MNRNKLIIAEKPSVAKAIASALGVNRKAGAYLYGNGYIVSWCFGHMLEFASPESYDSRYEKWNLKDLPIVPQEWKMRVMDGKGAQAELLKKLTHRDDVDCIVNACDAGREGELIFRNIYNYAGCTKPVKRLWISSMESDAIRSGFRNLKDSSEYDSLYAAAQCRAKADWLVGINATRFFSVLYHRPLAVGRVMTPTLAMLVQRENEINRFIPKPFYTINADCGWIVAVSDRFESREEAEKMLTDCKGKPLTVVDAAVKKHLENPPKLYDLTSLQRDANRLLGYTAQQTLDYLQTLYESGLCTYPRTDSQYLTDDMEKNVSELADTAADILHCDRMQEKNTKQVCNSRDVSDHHAIVPTTHFNNYSVDLLPLGEQEIIKLICRRVLCAVSMPYEYEETSYELQIGDLPFKAKESRVVNPGWRRFEDKKADKDENPVLNNKGSLNDYELYIKEGSTSSAKHYTEDTLLAAMENAGRESMPTDAERRGLGTPATRAATLEKLVTTKFMERKKSGRIDRLIPSESGNSIITVIPEELQSPLLTAEWESRLKAIENGEERPEQFMTDITLMLEDLIAKYTPLQGAEVLFPSGREIVGKCPRCGADVTEGKKGFFCEHNECRFALWLDSKYFADKKITVTKPLVKTLLADGRVHLDKIYSSKKDKYYAADIVMTDDGECTCFSLDFSNAKNK